MGFFHQKDFRKATFRPKNSQDESTSDGLIKELLRCVVFRQRKSPLLLVSPQTRASAFLVLFSSSSFYYEEPVDVSRCIIAYLFICLSVCLSSCMFICLPDLPRFVCPSNPRLSFSIDSIKLMFFFLMCMPSDPGSCNQPFSSSLISFHDYTHKFTHNNFVPGNCMERCHENITSSNWV